MSYLLCECLLFQILRLLLLRSMFSVVLNSSTTVSGYSEQRFSKCWFWFLQLVLCHHLRPRAICTGKKSSGWALEPVITGFKSWLCHLPAVLPQKNYLTFLTLSLLICNANVNRSLYRLEVIKILHSMGHMEAQNK